MLKLRDLTHLPQLDALFNQLINDEPGVIVLAGIDARKGRGGGEEVTFLPSASSAIFNILMQEILLAHPYTHALVISQDKALARVPRQFSRRVRHLPVEQSAGYRQQIDLAMRQQPGLVVVDRLDEENAPALFRAASTGLRILVQLDTVLRGPSVARHIVELGVPRQQLGALRWIVTTQRLSLLCEQCKISVDFGAEMIERLCGRYPRLRPVCDELRKAQEKARGGRQVRRTGFYHAGSCEHCRQSGYNGDIAVYDLFHSSPTQGDLFAKNSLLSLEEYALRLAAEGLIDLDDLLELENDHLRRTYRMLTASEQALSQTNAELTRKLFELEASNRVLVQRTEVLMSLQELGQALITSSDLGDLAGRVCRRASELCGADLAVLYLRRPSGEHGQEVVEVLAVRGWDAEAVGHRLEAGQVFGRENDARITRFMQTPPGFRIDAPANGPDENKQVIKMGLRVPLMAQEQPVGVMIVQSTQKESFNQGEMALLQTFANQAALAVQRAGLVDDLRGKIIELEAAQAELVTKERIERELELARQVQQSMLPHSFPEVPGYALSARNEPARQVGGDFYDVILLDDDHFGLVVADVADKGMPAALYMALTRSLLLAEARRASSPLEALHSVNHLLLELGELDGFVSLFYGVVDRTTRQMTYVRAGHERPLLLRDDRLHPLAGDGMVLGLLESDQLNLTEETVQLQTGDRLILYTDGITDVADAQGQFLTLQRFQPILLERAQLSAEEICQSLFEALAQYRGMAEPFDDMTLLVLQVLES